MKVVLVNLNLISVPAIAPYALDVLGSSLEADGHEVDILDLCPEGDAISAIHSYFMAHEPDLVGLSMRNAGDLYFPSLLDLQDKGSFLVSHRTLIDVIKTWVDPERIIIGGAGFSVNPSAFLKRLDLKYGVRGPGEVVLREIVNQLRHRSLRELSDGADIFVFDGRGRDIGTAVKRTFVNNEWYYAYGGQAGIRTSSGCALRCCYCAEPAAVGGVYQRSAVENTLGEFDQLITMGVRDFHSADSEFNMPLAHSKKVLKAVIDRQYGRDVRFWTYCQPSPFDEEFAKLLARAGTVGINFGTDHTDSQVLSSLGKWYSHEDIARATRLCKDNGIAVMHELLFASPGDTPDKMYRAIEFVRELEPWVVGVTIGLGIFPDTPLGSFLERAMKSGMVDQGFYFAGEPMVDPTFYVDPAFRIPDVFEQLSAHIGPDDKNIMLPTTSSTGSTNNQLVNSDRVRHQLLVEKRKGPSWFHFPDRRE